MTPRKGYSKYKVRWRASWVELGDRTLSEQQTSQIWLVTIRLRVEWNRTLRDHTSCIELKRCIGQVDNLRDNPPQQVCTYTQKKAAKSDVTEQSSGDQVRFTAVLCSITKIQGHRCPHKQSNSETREVQNETREKAVQKQYKMKQEKRNENSSPKALSPCL